jgi:ABC-type protease/lipase transport system fused ATPase/permease subunit
VVAAGVTGGLVLFFSFFFFFALLCFAFCFYFFLFSFLFAAISLCFAFMTTLLCASDEAVAKQTRQQRYTYVDEMLQ